MREIIPVSGYSEQKVVMKIETPHGPLTIRPCQAADAEKFRTLRLEALRLHPEVFSSDFAVNEAQPMSYWDERLKSQGIRGMIYFAESLTGLAGMCGVGLGDSPKTAHSGIIWGVYVRPA